MRASTEPRARDLLQHLAATDTRTRLLHGAARVFARKGIERATVADILASAGLSRRTFYQSFGSKEDVLAALFELVTERILQTVIAAGTSGDPLERFEQGMDAYLEMWRSGGRLGLVLLTESMRAESRLAPMRQRVMDALAARIAEAAEARWGRPVHPWVFRGLHLALEGLLAHASDGPDQDAALSHVRGVMGAMARQVLAGAGEALPVRP